MRYIQSGEVPPPADLIVLPGSNSVRFHLAWLRREGWVPVICGGFQMLGTRIRDPLGLEWAPGEGSALGLLELETALAPEMLIRVARPADPRAGSAWPAIQTAASIIPATSGLTYRGATEPLIEILDLTDPRRIDRLDKHRLDIALSLGRHAAERARLAGARHLIGLATGMTERLAAPTPSDPYEQLRACGQVEIAVLVGAAIACAQIGLQVSLPDRIGKLAAATAIRLNPSIRDWLTDDGGRPSRSTIAHPSGVARVDDESVTLAAGDLVSALA